MSIISIIETAVSIRVMDPISMLEDTLEPMIGDAASISEGINIM